MRQLDATGFTQPVVASQPLGSRSSEPLARDKFSDKGKERRSKSAQPACNSLQGQLIAYYNTFSH